MAFKTFAILLLAVTAIANPIAVPDASADAKDILNDNLELEDRTAKIPSCDYSRWAAGGIKAPYKGKFNINYPIREFGPEKPYCTMKVGAKGEGVRSLQRALTK